jgi:hypothetical protein
MNNIYVKNSMSHIFRLVYSVQPIYYRQVATINQNVDGEVESTDR